MVSKTHEHPENGSALLATLVIVTAVTLLAGTVMSFHVVQNRFIQRDVHRLQARYAAEAGLYWALAKVRENPDWRTEGQFVDLPGSSRCHVAVESFGGFIRLRADARVGRARSTLAALVGEEPP